MSKLRVINQPLRMSDADLYNLEEEFDHWDHKAESMAIRNARQQRRIFNTEL